MEFLEHRDENGETADEQWRRLSSERGAILRRHLVDGGTVAELAGVFLWCRSHKSMARRVYELRHLCDPMRLVLTPDEAAAWRASRYGR